MTGFPGILSRTTAGERITDLLSADTHNQTVNALLNLRAQEYGDVKDALETLTNNVVSRVNYVNTTGAALAAGAVVIPTVPSVLPANMAQYDKNDLLYWEVRNPTTGDHGNFLIVRDPTASGGHGMAYSVSSVVYTKVYFDAQSEWMDWCDVDVSNPARLMAMPHGSARILWSETVSSGGGEVDAFVLMQGSQDRGYLGTADGDILADEEGDVIIYQNDASTGYTLRDVKHNWMDQGLKISSGKEVIVQWFDGEKEWRVTHAECEDPDPWPYTARWNGDYSATGPPTP